MTVIRLFDARPDMHITDCTLLGGSPFAPRPPRDIKAALLIYSAPLSLHYPLYHIMRFLSICYFAVFGEFIAPSNFRFGYFVTFLLTSRSVRAIIKSAGTSIGHYRKGVCRLSIIFNFVFSVIAGIYSYYICKWLDGEK